MGSTEGLVFIAKHDDLGKLLAANCNYILSGKMPAARFWTLRIADREMVPIGTPSFGEYVLDSTSVLRDRDKNISIRISKNMTPGNWLQIGGDGNQVLIMTLYDTSIPNVTGAANITMPQIRNVGCSND